MTWSVALAMMLACVLAPMPVRAQTADDTPKPMEDVGVTEHLDEQVPLDLQFVDEQGRPVRLGSFFESGKPVLITINYYRCPMLCTLQLNGLGEALKTMGWTPGEQFEIVTVSMDPNETPALARGKKQNYIRETGRPEVAGGWHFLLSPDEQNVRKLAEALGFRYRYDEETNQYAHSAAAMICTPDGRISRYLYGVQFYPKTLRLSLVEAADGQIGSTFDRILLTCFHYDAERGRYSVAANNLMRFGGGLTVIVLALVVMKFRRIERRRRAAAAAAQEGMAS